MQKLYVMESVYRNDRPDYLKLALDSIFAQTYRDFTLLLFIDGEITDGLRSVILSYKDCRLKIIEVSENMGLAFALNKMLEYCKDASYIARMDSDDISMPNRFEKQLNYLDSHPEIDVIGGAINEIDENGNSRGKIIHYPCDPDNCRSFFAKRNPVAHPAVMFRSRFFEKVGWKYPTDYIRNEDTRLWHEGYKHECVIANIPDVILNYRITDNMFKQRRNGKEFAISQLCLRKMIIRDLHYGIMSYIYAYAMFILMISPSWILKLSYKILR